jgi:Copper transport outer membrane protein, MctB
MINFRFHVVSLIAIFLALALGVVIGAGVIDRGVVDTLNSRLDRVEAKSDRIEGENDQLSTENGQLSTAIGDMQPFAVSGTLAGDDIGVVAVRGVNGDTVNDLVAAAQQADATVTGKLWLEDKWSLTSDDDVTALQDAIGSSTRNKATLRNEAWEQLADRLANPGVAGDGSDDLLVALQQAGFLGFDAIDGSTVTTFPGRSAAVSLVVGNEGSVAPELVALPLATALDTAELPTVVAGVWAETTDGPTRAEAVQPIRDSDLAKSVSTVDDLDQPPGPTTVVLTLSDLFTIPTPTVGHYGYGPNTQPLPDPVNS